ncbi:MAG TPA: FCD domain-containing protein, partial [Candidatus Acidoferrum sp.]|nr:FCD domain-containing protein [Candidatus Acidoferrum sp.]
VRAAWLYLQVNGTTIDDVYEARLIIEPAAAGRAAARAGKKGTSRLRQLLTAEEDVDDDPVGWAHAAVRFHEAVVDLAGLQTLNLFAGMLSEIIDRHQVAEVSRAGGENIENRRHADRAHSKLLTLIEAGDTEGAEALWRSHIFETNKRYAKTAGGMPVIDLFD